MRDITSKNSLNHTRLFSLTIRFSDFLALRFGRCRSEPEKLKSRGIAYIYSDIHAYTHYRVTALMLLPLYRL